MIPPAAPALTTVRGFQGTPVTSGDEDSDYGLQSTPRRRPILDDIVSRSANGSPSLRPAASPAMSGIAKLRLQMDDLSLDDPASRTSSMTRAFSMSRNGSLQGRVPSAARGLGIVNGVASGIQSMPMSRSASNDGSVSSEGGSTSYEINLENDFVSESVRDRTGPGAGGLYGVIEGGLNPNRKMAADDFETICCLGKGTYGTVHLVKQRATGRLYAQKQFKKASLVVHKKLVEQTKTERQILELVNRHPFVVNLYYAFQDHEKLYLILEYGQGGELFTHLNTEKMFSEPVAAFYMAEMVLALSYLHDNLGVIYRDLKPENCLLDAEGHLLLTDFGLSKVSVDDEECRSMLGTVEYMAPEVIKGVKYGKAVDWWSFGAMGFDLMTGSPPFRGGNNKKIQENIVKQKLAFPYFMSPDAKDLLTRLLRKDPAKRLGANMPKDLQVIKGHRFFRKIDWRKLEARELEPPIQPLITDPELAENFAAEFTGLELSSPIIGRGDDPFGPVSGRDGIDDPFGGFSFVASTSLLEGSILRTAARV